MGRTTIIKWVFFVFNVMLLMLVYFEFTLISLVAVNFSTRTLIGYIVLYILILFIGVLGCCSAYKEDAHLMKASAISLLIMIIYILLFDFVIADYDKTAVKSFLEEKWAEESEHPDSMAYVQQKYQCCGKDSPDDYKNILNRPIPNTCYSLASELYERGCVSAVEADVSPLQKKIFPKTIYVFIILMLACASYLIFFFTKHQLDDDPRHQQGTTT